MTWGQVQEWLPGPDEVPSRPVATVASFSMARLEPVYRSSVKDFHLAEPVASGVQLICAACVSSARTLDWDARQGVERGRTVQLLP